MAKPYGQYKLTTQNSGQTYSVVMNFGRTEGEGISFFPPQNSQASCSLLCQCRLSQSTLSLRVQPSEHGGLGKSLVPASVSALFHQLMASYPIALWALKSKFLELRGFLFLSKLASHSKRSLPYFVQNFQIFADGFEITQLYISGTSMVTETGVFTTCLVFLQFHSDPNYDNLAFAPLCLEHSTLIMPKCTHQINPSTSNAPVLFLTCLLTSQLSINLCRAHFIFSKKPFLETSVVPQMLVLISV